MNTPGERPALLVATIDRDAIEADNIFRRPIEVRRSLVVGVAARRRIGVMPDGVPFGLMCLPPIDEEPSLHFCLLAELARRCGLNQLSMGMTGDYEIAVRFGATHVRVGTAIFGQRVSAA